MNCIKCGKEVEVLTSTRECFDCRCESFQQSIKWVQCPRCKKAWNALNIPAFALIAVILIQQRSVENGTKKKRNRMARVNYLIELSRIQRNHYQMRRNFNPDHIDGNPLNNLKQNLRFLCPNCHSQTETFGVKNQKPSQVGLCY